MALIILVRVIIPNEKSYNNGVCCMLLDKSLHRVLLNPKLLQQSTSEQHLIYLVKQYLKTGYKNYRLLRVEDGFAICKREDE